MLDQLLERIAEDWERDAEPRARLRILIEGMFERLDDNPAFFRLALIGQGSVGVDSELALIGLEVAGMLQGLYLDGLSTGLFRTMDPDRAISLIGQQIYGAMSVRAGEPFPLPRADAAAEVTEFVLRGLST
jgi:hypothetical protein